MDRAMKKFILTWDCNGLEACIDITDAYNSAVEFDKEKIFELIKDPTVEPTNPHMRYISSTINHLIMRARANPQRHYEIYSVDAEDGLTENDITDYFNNGPQAAVDVIRKKGQKLYSDRATKQAVIF